LEAIHDRLFRTQAFFPSETVLACLLVVGFVLAVAAFLWAMVALIRHGGRGLSTSILALIAAPILAFIAMFFVLAADVRIGTLSADHVGTILLLAVLASILILGLVVLIGSFANYSKTRGPIRLGIVGVLLVATPFVWTRTIEPVVFNWISPAWVSKVNGELHVTVTGSKSFDYGQLKKYEDAVVLQMANADVTDETLKQLEGFKLLKELDLNDTQVTDAGLAILKNCPSLEKLRLSNTKITDAGFREHVLPRDWIMEIEVSNTPVESKTLRLWKAERDGRKFVK
jgi:hypothetical protein